MLSLIAPHLHKHVLTYLGKSNVSQYYNTNMHLYWPVRGGQHERNWKTGNT